MARKNFSKGNVKIEASNSTRDVSHGPATTKPEQTKVFFKANASGVSSYDFNQWYGKNIDAVVRSCQQAIEMILEEETRSHSTIYQYCANGLRNLFKFCEFWATSVLQREMALNDISSAFIQSYIGHLKDEYQFVSAYNINAAAKGVLLRMQKMDWILREGLYPKNPFPNVNRKKKGENPLSAAERKRVTHALRDSLKPVFEETGPLSGMDLALCALAIDVRTGLNLGPLLNMPPDCIHPHPLKPNRQLLVYFKNRSHKWLTQAIRSSEDVEVLQTAMPDVAPIIELVINRNQKLRDENPEYKGFLFTYKGEDFISAGKITQLNPSSIGANIKTWVKKVGLLDDDGMPLKLNTSILRKTWVNRVFELSKEDPVVTAQLAGHSGTMVLESDYMRAPAEEKKNFSLMGEVMTQELLEPIKAENTPVAKCSKSFDNNAATRGKEVCSDFLSCVRCKSFVVTPEDLHRLFSLYWVLVRERKDIGTMKWNRYYAHIIRIIDKEITQIFGEEVMKQARNHAEHNPHPFWKDGRDYLYGDLI